ncbi:MAG: bifunctional alpha/beta hydrolase/OsmC family protein [Deltaproteobacteria bacterium]|nr:bifunctional alpha/beta hydrolase/OsmC family protein [Deltaproteobacteria bacterium]
MPAQTLSLSFPGARGTMLAARLDLPPAAAPIAYALFAHCFTCSKETKATTYVSAALAERGIAVLRFDFTGLGGSDGDFAGTNFSSNVEDLVSAADYLRQHYRAPAILVGHSLGGSAVLAAARRVPEAVAVATIGSPFDPAHVLHLIKDREAVERDGEVEVDIGGRPFRIRRQFLEDIAGSKLGDEVANMGKALLVMHSPRDSVVGVDNATRIFSAARHPRSFISLDPADHMLSRREDALYAGNILASWAARYLPASADTSPAPVPGTVLVEETREGKFSQRVVAGRHVIRADEPLAAGGMDSGLSPYDLVLAGLGACTSMTIRMYADLKGFPLERATVELRHEKIHATDCTDCETKDGKIDRIDRLIRLEGPLSEEQRAKLLEISNKCPVHRTLHSEVNIPTRLAD